MLIQEMGIKDMSRHAISSMKLSILPVSTNSYIYLIIYVDIPEIARMLSFRSVVLAAAVLGVTPISLAAPSTSGEGSLVQHEQRDGQSL